MGTKKDLNEYSKHIGEKHNKLTITGDFYRKRLNNNIEYVYCKCLCECGNLKDYLLMHVLHNNLKSCGCIRKGKALTHGLTNDPIYKVYRGIKNRCYMKGSTRYKFYGAKGIRMCDDWYNNPVHFYDWAVLNGYQKGLTIDRIDVSGNYEPLNCRWITIKEQGRNKSNTPKYTYNGVSKPLVEWAEIYQVDYGLLRDRIKKGKLTFEQCVGIAPITSFKDARNIAILKVDLNDNIICRYKSLSSTNMTPKQREYISKCCNGKLNTYLGYKWKFDN